MTNDGKIKKLEQYRNDLSHIGMMFHGSFGTAMMRDSDRPKYLTLIMSVNGLLQDEFGENEYTKVIKQIHNESIELHDYDAPTHQDFESIVAVIDAAIERMKNGKEPHKIKTNEKLKLEPTEKVTLKWLWDHVPLTLWCFFIGLLISAFTLGVTVANTKLYRSAISLITPNTNANKNVPETRE